MGLGEAGQRVVAGLAASAPWADIAVGVVAGSSMWFASTDEGAEERFGEIGSLAKILTALTAVDLARRGRVSLDGPLPGEYGAALPGVTLRALATHTAGLPRLPPNLDLGAVDPANPYAGYDADALLEACRLCRPEPGPHLYSNFGYMVLARAVEEAAGEPFESVLWWAVLDRLGLGPDFAAVRPGTVRESWLAGHRAGVAVRYWDHLVLGPGGLAATVRGLAGLAAALVEPGRAGFKRTARLVRPPVVAVDADVSVTLAFYRVGEMLSHQGATGGFRSFIGLLPRRGVAVVAVAGEQTLALDRACVELLRTAAGVSP